MTDAKRNLLNLEIKLRGLCERWEKDIFAAYADDPAIQESVSLYIEKLATERVELLVKCFSSKKNFNGWVETEVIMTTEIDGNEVILNTADGIVVDTGNNELMSIASWWTIRLDAFMSAIDVTEDYVVITLFPQSVNDREVKLRIKYTGGNTE